MASAIAYAVDGTTVTPRGAQASESIAGIVFIYCEELKQTHVKEEILIRILVFAAAYSPGLGRSTSML